MSSQSFSGASHPPVRVYHELLTYQRGNQFYRLPLTSEWYRRTFDELFAMLRTSHHAILVAVHQASGHVRVNPVSYQFAEGDGIIVIADREVRL